MGSIWSKQIILGENGQKLGHLGPKWCHRPKFWESDKIIFSQKVSKNYFRQVYGQKFGQKCYYWGKFGQNRPFW